jgi:hypothetical protein
MPPETFSISYDILFRVKVLHRYFLNYATRAYDASGLSEEEKKIIGIIRLNYEISKFWQITPGENTRHVLKNLQMIYRPLPDGFCLAVATESSLPLVPLPEELNLYFGIYPTDNFFLNYTNITKPVLDKLLKENQLFVLSNKATLPDLAANTLNANETIAATDLLERKDAPAGEISTRAPLGFIHIRHSLSAGISLLSAGGKVQHPLTFNLKLKNRATQWQYKENSLGLKPLVQHGLIPATAGGKELSNPTLAATIYKDDDFYSIIY